MHGTLHAWLAAADQWHSSHTITARVGRGINRNGDERGNQGGATQHREGCCGRACGSQPPYVSPHGLAATDRSVLPSVALHRSNFRHHVCFLRWGNLFLGKHDREM